MLSKDLLACIFKKINIIEKLKCREISKKIKKIIDEYPGIWEMNCIIDWQNKVEFTPFSEGLKTQDFTLNCIDKDEIFLEIYYDFQIYIKRIKDETINQDFEKYFNKVNNYRDKVVIPYEIISEVYYYKNGRNDDGDWLLLFSFNTNKKIYGWMKASCDYEGFSSQGIINFALAKTIPLIISEMTKEDRLLFLKAMK